MATLEETSLSSLEQRVLERLTDLLRGEFGENLVSVWLYGSRARGEARAPESDVDVLVVVRQRRPDDDLRLIRLVGQAAEAEGASAAFFSPLLYTAERVAQRRKIRSFFIQEVDRDKVVLWGRP